MDDDSETNTGLTYGIGLQWDPIRNLGGGDIGKGDVNVLGVSALYRF